MLMKPYFWLRPAQLLRRARLAVIAPEDPLLVKLPWGLMIECHPYEVIGSSLARTGVYDIVTTEALMRLVDPGELALDVGANIGYMTSALAARMGATGRIIAFEPNPSVFEMLETNVARWQVAGLAEIETLQRAVSDRSGSAELAVPAARSDNQGTATLLTPGAPYPSVRTVTVDTVTLDELIPQEHVGLLKLDVERHEASVLGGGRRLLTERRIRDIVFEDHDAYPNVTTAFLEHNGYAIFTLALRPLGVSLMPPGNGELATSWDAPARIATLDPGRVRARLFARGWSCLRRPEGVSDEPAIGVTACPRTAGCHAANP
jgi:FkbM family methyltransferase